MTVVRRVSEGEARRSVVQRANDNALEILIFGLRLGAALAVLGAIVSAVALIWTADLRWLVTLALDLAIAAGAGWAGFWVFGNEGWRRAETER